MNKDLNDLNDLINSETALEEHVLSLSKDIINENIIDLLQLKISLVKEYDRNTTKIVSYLIETQSSIKGLETMQKLLDKRLDTHEEHYKSVHRIIDLLTFSLIEEEAVESPQDLQIEQNHGAENA